MDTEYLKQHLGACLSNCLCEVAERRPHDPIEYMSQWLYKYIENRQFHENVRHSLIIPKMLLMNIFNIHQAFFACCSLTFLKLI